MLRTKRSGMSTEERGRIGIIMKGRTLETGKFSRN
jgi:hypothetical protein